MTRTRRVVTTLKLEQVDPLALLAVLASFVLCALGAINGPECLAFVSGVAVKGRSDPSPPAA